MEDATISTVSGNIIVGSLKKRDAQQLCRDWVAWKNEEI